MNYEKLCLQVCDLAKEVGNYIKNEQKHLSSNKIEIKGVHDFVTEVDKISEQRIIKYLQSIFPNAGFIAEENTNTKRIDNFLLGAHYENTEDINLILQEAMKYKK